MTDRKARLAALAAKAGRVKQSDKEINFRNYTPVLSKNNEDNGVPEAKRAKTNDDEPSILERALEKARKQAIEQQTGAQDPVVRKKINWDLKRDIQPKLDKLEKRTQKAIVSLLKQRLEKEASTKNLD